VTTIGRAIQALVIFSALLGVPFLWQVNGLIPTDIFEFVAIGWVLFVIDSFLTVFRPTISYYLAFSLAILALGATLGEPAHYAFIQEGDLLPTVTLVAGSTAQVLLLILVPINFLKGRRHVSEPTARL
jgi:hypothetical protein